jgi:hypothetical protein
MALSNRERQRAWSARRNALARIAEALRQHDVKLFARMQTVAEKWTAKKRAERAQRRKSRAA